MSISLRIRDISIWRCEVVVRVVVLVMKVRSSLGVMSVPASSAA